MAQATLVVRRDSDTDIKMREMEVWVDGKFAATVDYGKSFEVPLDPGEHSVMVSNKLKKEKADFIVREGDSIVFQAANVMSKGMSVILAGLGMIVYHVTLKRIE
jgi:hypothetical protein